MSGDVHPQRPDQRLITEAQQASIDHLCLPEMFVVSVRLHPYLSQRLPDILDTHDYSLFLDKLAALELSVGRLAAAMLRGSIKYGKADCQLTEEQWVEAIESEVADLFCYTILQRYNQILRERGGDNG